MSKQKPEDMSDEMWAAVCIIMEDQQISSYREMTESHQAMIERMDHLETTWSEKQAHSGTGNVAAGETGTTAGGGSVGDGTGVTGTGGAQAGTAGGGTTPPPIVEKGEEEKKGSGRGGKFRWYERDGYAR